MAAAKRMNYDDRLVYVLTGDGELQEGQVWEALMYAAHNRVDNMIVTVDWNGQQIDGSNEEVLSLGNLPAKFEAFGWDVIRCTNGNDMRTIVAALRKAKAAAGKGKPVVLLMKTEMGAGVDFMMHTHKWHGSAPNADQTADALSQLTETLGDF
jgi:transketolase